MIASVLVALCATPARIVELPRPGSGKVVVQVFVPAPPKMSDREQAAWNVLASAMYDGTSEFSRDRLAQYSAQAGVPLLVEPMPEHMRLQVVEPKGGLRVACQIVEALCERATLSDTAILESVRRLRGGSLSPWQSALFDLQLPFQKVTADIVRNLYKVAFRPENLTLVFGGELEEGEGLRETADRFPAMSEGPPRRSRFDFAPRQRTKHAAPVTTYELRAPLLSLTSPTASARLLAVFALGVGKEGTMHRALREASGLTYRQEAVLWPGRGGWQPRFLWARAEADLELVGVARDLLLADVESWDGATLARAVAQARSALAGENPVSPVWIGQRVYGSELEDACSWAGLNVMMTGVQVDADALLAQTVTVDELKEAARGLLTQSQASVIPGS